MSTTEMGHGPKSTDGTVDWVPLDSLRPAKLNDAVYKPVDPDDPDVRALAARWRMQLKR